MSETSQQLLNDALCLSSADRGRLAALLIESLDGSDDPIAEEAWSDEIADRLDAMDRGDVRMIPWSDARDRLR